MMLDAAVVVSLKMLKKFKKIFEEDDRGLLEQIVELKQNKKKRC